MELAVCRREPRSNPERPVVLRNLQDLGDCWDRSPEVAKDVPRIPGLTGPFDGKNLAFLLPPACHRMRIRGIRILQFADRLSHQPSGSVKRRCDRPGLHLGSRRCQQPDWQRIDESLQDTIFVLGDALA